MLAPSASQRLVAVSELQLQSRTIPQPARYSRGFHILADSEISFLVPTQPVLRRLIYKGSDNVG